MSRRRLAVVVQRYGEEVSGGAELHARWLAEHLLALADVDVLTTCALDYTTWAPHYPPGVTRLNGVTVHRFPVDQERDWRRAGRETGRFLLQTRSIDQELAWMRQQGPISTPLLSFIQRFASDYDAFIFFTYLYATTFLGLPLVADRAILVPTAHDEPFLYLPIFLPTFHLPRVIVYNTETERQLVNRVTGNGHRRQDRVAGIGINVPDDVSADRFRQKYGVSEDFLLYVGRINEAKNVPALLQDFIRFRRHYPAPLQLILIGRSHLDLPRHPDIRHLGFVSEQDKFDAIKASLLVVIPSLYESLSMILLETWLMERPALVNGRCLVLKAQCRRSHGGLYYLSPAEFDGALHHLLASPRLRRQLGRQGRQFVAATYQWNTILAQYAGILDAVAPSADPAPRATI